MIQPKDALEGLIYQIEQTCDWMDTEQAKAAIPVAELHQQIVKFIQDNPFTFIKAFGKDKCKEIATLLTQLEALK